MGNFFAIFGPIGGLFNEILTYPIYNGLMLLYHLFGDFGLAIIVLTVLIKLILFPLTLQQLKSMKANQALQPKIAEIKKKYAKDQAGQMAATQALYKEYGVNPIAGCLPLLIQLPALYGLYDALYLVVTAVTKKGNNLVKLTAVNEHLYSFIPHFHMLPNLNLDWFTFINHSWSLSLIVPDRTLILPILAALATFVSLRMSQPKAAVAKANTTTATKDPMSQSTKTMQFIMPFVTFFFGMRFPAGLALYWVVSSMFQGFQQYFVTGWGSLFTTPNFKKEVSSKASNKSDSIATNGTANNTARSKSYTGDRQRERIVLEQAEESSDEEATYANGNGDLENRSRTAARGSSGPTQYNRRRQHNSSASARRRGSAQRSRG